FNAMMRKLLIVYMVGCSLYVSGQDPEFSQYYSAPLYLNPAFSGTGSDHRLILNHRNQWPAIANGFVTYAFSYDYNMSNLNSGLGVMIVTDKAGSANLRSTSLNFQYSYKVNLSSKWVLSSGLNFGAGFRNIDYNKLVFGDQLAFDGSSNTPTDDPVYGTIQN